MGAAEFCGAVPPCKGILFGGASIRAPVFGLRPILLETGECGCMHYFRKRSFWQSLVAVLVGNAIYFGVERFLPARAQHQLYKIDWGLVIDFWICLVCYGLVRLIRRG